jgi:hypothetical protein
MQFVENSHSILLNNIGICERGKGCASLWNAFY